MHVKWAKKIREVIQVTNPSFVQGLGRLLDSWTSEIKVGELWGSFIQNMILGEHFEKGE